MLDETQAHGDSVSVALVGEFPVEFLCFALRGAVCIRVIWMGAWV